MLNKVRLPVGSLFIWDPILLIAALMKTLQI